MQAMRNPDAKHIDFGFLKGCIPSNPKLLPSNIDMILERKGHFLFGEWKNEGEQFSEGQKILLRSLAKLENSEVIIITGNTEGAVEIKLIQQLNEDSKLIKIGESVQDLIDHINKWYGWVEYVESND